MCICRSIGSLVHERKGRKDVKDIGFQYVHVDIVAS